MDMENLWSCFQELSHDSSKQIVLGDHTEDVQQNNVRTQTSVCYEGNSSKQEDLEDEILIFGTQSVSSRHEDFPVDQNETLNANASRRGRKPLRPDLSVDERDLLRRKNNRDSARRSRQRRQAYFQHLRDQLQEQQRLNLHLRKQLSLHNTTHQSTE
mmetsp:Transcript_9016/g.16245  ORF Transcript_9016/g.16245 Transcript_9016/m.16245 type:complete len:157 (+) Transcript_9016:541-1011(+)